MKYSTFLVILAVVSLAENVTVLDGMFFAVHDGWIYGTSWDEVYVVDPSAKTREVFSIPKGLAFKKYPVFFNEKLYVCTYGWADDESFKYIVLRLDLRKKSVEEIFSIRTKVPPSWYSVASALVKHNALLVLKDETVYTPVINRLYKMVNGKVSVVCSSDDDDAYVNAPTSDGSRVYFVVSDIYSGDGAFLATDKSGNVLWRKSSHEMGVFHHAPAIGRNGTLYLGTSCARAGGCGWIYAVNSRNGEIIWKLELEDLSPEWRPAIDGEGNLYFATYRSEETEEYKKQKKAYDDWAFRCVLFGECENKPEITAREIPVGFVIAISREGNVLWKKRVEDAMLKSTPAVGKNAVYVVGWDGTVMALNKKDGRVLWRRNFDDNFSMIIMDEGRLYIDGSLLYVLKVDDEPSGIWPMWRRDPENTGACVCSSK